MKKKELLSGKMTFSNNREISVEVKLKPATVRNKLVRLPVMHVFVLLRSEIHGLCLHLQAEPRSGMIIPASHCSIADQYRVAVHYCGLLSNAHVVA